MNKMLTYVKDNWKSIVFVLVIACLILFNVKQYQASQVIVRQNEKINTEYQAMLQKEIIYNQQIAEYRSQIAKKDSVITTEKNKIEKTEAQLQVSQDEARRLSRRILNQKTDNPTAVQEYVEICDSLAVVAPILADQVDTLKSQNKILVVTIEEKSILQDSIIKKKDIIISEKSVILNKTLENYNKATDELVKTENKLNKEKKKKSLWKKVAIGLGLAVGVAILTK